MDTRGLRLTVVSVAYIVISNRYCAMKSRSGGMKDGKKNNVGSPELTGSRREAKLGRETTFISNLDFPLIAQILNSLAHDLS